MKDPAFEIPDHRAYWVSVAERLARPLLTSLASGRFNEEFPVEGDAARARGLRASMESASRLLAGIAPWLEADITDASEAKVRDELLELAQESLHSAQRPPHYPSVQL